MKVFWLKPLLFLLLLGLAMSVKAEGIDPRLTSNLYIIFDGSGSMSEEKCSGTRTKIEVAKEALQTFLRSVPDDYNVGLFVFDRDGQRELVGLGPVARNELVQKIGSITAGGSTPLCDAIDFSRGQLLKQNERQLGYGNYTLLIVTDGEANRKSELPAFIKPVTEQGVYVQVIGFCLSRTHSLKKMVHKYREASSAEELEQAFSEVLGEAEQFDDIGQWDESEGQTSAQETAPEQPQSQVGRETTAGNGRMVLYVALAFLGLCLFLVIRSITKRG